MKLYANIALITVFTTATILISGCGDTKKEEKQASQAIKQAISKFDDTGDIRQAQKILRNAPKLGNSQTIEIINANLLLAKASEIKAEQTPKAQEMMKICSVVSDLSQKINDLIAKKANLISIQQERKTFLNVLENGTEDGPGLAGLKNNKIEIEDKVSQIATDIFDLQDTADQILDEAQRIQDKANALFDQAQNTDDVDKQIELQKQAYQILAGKDGQDSKAKLMGEYQQYVDEINLLKSQLEIKKAELANVSSEVEKTSKQIDDYKTANIKLNLSGNISKFNTEISNIDNTLTSNISNLSKISGQYQNSFNEIISNIEKAEKKLKKTGNNLKSSKDIKQLIKLLKAEATASKANFYSSSAKVYLSIAKGLAATGDYADLSFSSSIKAASEKYIAIANQMASKAFEEFSKADEAYKKTGFKPKCDILKQQILNQINLFSLGKDFGEDSISQTAIESAKTAAEEASECDEDFEQSFIAEKLRELTN